jgi:hypothetical protein
MIAERYSQLSLTRSHLLTIGKSGDSALPDHIRNGLKKVGRWIKTVDKGRTGF